METWEQILLGIFALLLLLWFVPGIKPMLEKSKAAPKDWQGFLIPIALVIALVIFLAMNLHSGRSTIKPFQPNQLRNRN